jgi:hypothetical protein
MAATSVVAISVPVAADTCRALPRRFLNLIQGENMKRKITTVVLSAALLTSGCASIVSESTYPVAINSAPDGADFVVTNRKGVKVHAGRTPATVSLKSGNGYFSAAAYTVAFHKDGYDDKQIVINSTMDGWYIGNILLGGLIGMLIVDPATGAMWKLPETESVSLDAKQLTGLQQPALKIVSLQDVPESDRHRLVRID